MLVKNENNKFVDLTTYSNEIFAKGLGDDVVTEEDAQNALADLYLLQVKEQEAFVSDGTKMLGEVTISGINKLGLWKKLKEIFCSIATEGSTFDSIIGLILKAIGSIIPGGIFVEELVRKIVKYFLQKGVGKICEA